MGHDLMAGMGRTELEAQVQRLRAEVDAANERARVAEQHLVAAAKDRDINYVNLTSVQALSTRQLEELRVWRRGELTPLAEAIAIARTKHPGGSDLTSLLSEAGEVARAMYSETPERVREELIDVAVVAMRLYFGEIKKREVGFRRGE